MSMNELPRIVDARERLPVKFGLYWVRVDGVRKCISLHEFDYYLERFDCVEWVEEQRDIFTVGKAPGPEPYFFKTFTGEQDDENNIPSRQIKPLVKKQLKNTVATKQLTAVAETSIIVDPTVPVPNLPKGTVMGNFNNLSYQLKPDDPLTTEKLQVRSYIIDFWQQHGKYPIQTVYLTLVRVRQLYPGIKKQPEVPAHLRKEMEWVYGKRGVLIIERKMSATYRQNVTNGLKKHNNNQDDTAQID